MSGATPLRIACSDRVLSRQVGGNTRYVEAVYDGLRAHGVEPVELGPLTPLGRRGPSPARSVDYALAEGLLYGRRARAAGAHLFHAVADTGPVISDRLPVVATIQGFGGRYFAARSRAGEALWRRRVQRCAQLATTVITGSESSKRDIVECFGVSATQVEVIRHGIDHQRFQPGVPSPERLDAAGVEPGRFILYVGNIDPRKRVDLVLDAWELSGLAASGRHLVLASRHAWGADDVVARVSRGVAGVRWLRDADDDMIRDLYRSARAFVFPSEYEGFGFPVLEAQACGAPVIASDRGALAENLGSSARTLSRLDAALLADELRQIVASDDRCAELRELGLVNVQRFRWETSVAEHLQVLTEAASGA